MVKVYYRYVRQRVFGVLASSECNVRIVCDDDTAGTNLTAPPGVVVGRNELAAIWNSKSSEEAAVFVLDEDANKDGSHLAVSVATKLRFTTFVEVHPIDKRILGIGYSDGTLRLWRTPNAALDAHRTTALSNAVCTQPLAAFCGHKNIITSVAFSLDGQFAATGGKDADIVVWDLLSQKGECRLSGHAQSISSLVFCHSSKVCTGTGTGTGTQQTVEVDRKTYYLISGGKDGIIKVWDIKLHFALQTLADHEGGVNALLLNEAQTLLFTGGASPSLVVYRVLSFGTSSERLETSSDVLEMYCKVDRRAYFGNIVQLSLATDGTASRDNSRTGGNNSRTGGNNSRTGGNNSRTGGNKAHINRLEGRVTAVEDTADDGLESFALSTATSAGTSYRVQQGGASSDYVVIANTSKKRMELFTVRPGGASVHGWDDAAAADGQTKKKKKRRKTNNGDATAVSVPSDSPVVSSPVQTVSIVSWQVLELNDIVQSMDYRSNIQTLVLALRSTGAIAVVHAPFAEIARMKPKPSSDIKKDLPDELKKINFAPEGSTGSTGSLETHEDQSDDDTATTAATGGAAAGGATTAATGGAAAGGGTGGGTVRKSLMHLQGHHGVIRNIAFSHDDLMIATFEEDCVKVWNIHSCNCIRSFTNCGKAITGAFLAGNTHLVVGSADGVVMLYNLNTAAVASVVDIGVPVTAMCLLLDFTGVYCATTDKNLRRLRFTVSDFDADGTASTPQASGGAAATTEAVQVELEEDQVTEVMDSIADIQCGIDGKFICLAYLNNTMQLLHADTLNVYLTLYGHKLPVTSVAFSSDCTILASASSDKSIKIWGTDFGNIQRSWIAHNDAVSKVAFAPGTHHLVSTGRDGLVKMWDVDTKDLICSFSGHRGAVTALAVSLDAHLVVSTGVDKSIRVLMRTEDQFVLEEVREAEAEEEMERAATNSDALTANTTVVHEEVIVNRTSRDAMTAVRSTEVLIETLDNAKSDWDSEVIYNKLLQEYRRQSTSQQQRGAPPSAPDHKLTKSPHQAVIDEISSISANALFEILIALPFAAAEKLLEFIADFLEAAEAVSVPLPNIEASTRVALALVQLHYGVLSVSGNHRKLLLRLQSVLRSSVKNEMDDISFCKHAMDFLRIQSELETSKLNL